ncbi:MAG: hypothetical protein HY722_08710 [Planctomycetes bacterium]|nr:hypothetical protein [Planctomycetota bacterium]
MPHPSPQRPTTPDVPTLDHERLRVYQSALAFDRLAVTLLRRLPRGCAGLSD